MELQPILLMVQILLLLLRELKLQLVFQVSLLDLLVLQILLQQLLLVLLAAEQQLILLKGLLLHQQFQYPLQVQPILLIL